MAPLLLAFLLGPHLRKNLRQSLILGEGSPMIFTESPISICLILFTLAILIIPMIKNMSGSSAGPREKGATTSNRRAAIDLRTLDFNSILTRPEFCEPIICDYNARGPINMQHEHLKTIEQRLLWLSHWMIYHANYIRPKEDGIKGWRASGVVRSLVSIMTALYSPHCARRTALPSNPTPSPVFLMPSSI